jgi:hypothetical protein
MVMKAEKSKHVDNSRLKRSATIILLVLFIPIACIALILFSVLAYCNQFINHSAFLDDNNLDSTDEVYEFITRELESFSDDVNIIQDYLLRYELDCTEYQEYTPYPESPLAQIEFDSIITCFIPVSNAAFLGIENILNGKLSVCYFDPRLRMNFLFLNNTFVEVKLDRITTGL